MIGLALSLNRCINASDEARALAAIRRNGGTVLRSGLIRNYFDSAGTTPATVDNPVGLVQDSVGSNNATQPTVGSKPTLRRGLLNQLLWSGDFTNVAWLKNGVTPTGGQPDSMGGNSACRLQAAGGAYRYIYESVIWPTGQPATLAIKVKSYSGASQAFRLAYGSSGAVYSPILTATTSWQVLVVPFTSSSPDVCAVVSDVSGASASAFDIVVERIGLFSGTVTAAQIEAAGGIPLTTTAPASSANGKYWWQFDPAAPGDFLQTSITTGNEGWVCAGVTLGAVGVGHHLFGNGANAATDVGAWLRVPNTNSAVTLLVSNGTSRETTSTLTTAFAGIPKVIDGGWNASTMFTAIDGIETSTAKTVNCTTSKTCQIGGSTTHGWYTNGAMPVQVICPTLPPAADRALIRAWVGSLQGQTL